MLATRVIFLGVTALVWIINGWALLQAVGALSPVEGLTTAVLVANMVLMPLVMWSSYRTGQLTEEAYRSNNGG